MTVPLEVSEVGEHAMSRPSAPSWKELLGMLSPVVSCPLPVCQVCLFASSWTIRDWWLREKMLAKSWLLGEVTAQTLSKHLPEGLLQHLDGIVLLSTGTSEHLLRQGTEGSLFWCTGILKLTCSVFKIHISSEFFEGHFYAWISNFFGTRINQFGFPRASWSTFLALISLPKLLFALEFNISGE